MPRAHGSDPRARRVRRRHLSPATRAALAHTRELQIDLGDLRCLGLATSPSEHDEAPVRVHPLSGVLPKVGVGIDALVAIAPPDRAPIHPSLRQLGDSAAGYLRARQWWRRWYLTRQLAYGVLVAGVVAAMPVIAAATGGATVQLANRAVREIGAPVDRVAAAAADVVHEATGTRAGAVPAVHTTKPAPASVFRGLWVDGPYGHVFVPYPADPNGAFLRCTRGYESDTAGGYRAIDPSYRHFGAYQFLQSTWNNVARRTGLTYLIGINPAYASHQSQDFLALYLDRWQGASHWQGRCAGL